MTDVKVLFGDVVAMKNENGKLVVMKGEKRVSPYEYGSIKFLTPKCWAFQRLNIVAEDLLFSSGVWFLGAKYAYVLKSMGKKEDKELIAAVGKYGKYVLDEHGNLRAFIPGNYSLYVLDGEFLVSSEGPASQVEVYDLRGSLLAMGPMEEAVQNARRLKEMLEWLA